MYRLLSTCLETASAAVFLIPVFLYLHNAKFQNIKTSGFTFFFTLYLCTVYTIAGLPNISYIRFDPNFNIIPFRYFFSDHTTILNVILFIPTGLFLPYLNSKFRYFFPTILFGLSMSFFIEILQIFTLRATDINDLLTNTVGTAIGFVLEKTIEKLCPGLFVQKGNIDIKLIVFLVFVTMFFIHPLLSNFLSHIPYL